MFVTYHQIKLTYCVIWMATWEFPYHKMFVNHIYHLNTKVNVANTFDHDSKPSK
jgi:hypothetical protein